MFLGAESTGTTTVSQAVAARLAARGGAFTATAWVPEHGRDFTIERLAMAHALTTRVGRPATTMDDITWTSEDFVDIAARQNQLEDEAARTGGPVLVCDTDAFTTGIWHERYMGHRSAAVERLGRRHPLYLLTDHSEVPFVQDGIRDGEHIRAWMTHRLAEALAATDRPFQILTGTVEERTEAALAAIDELLARSWRFADPLLPPAPAAPGEFFP